MVADGEENVAEMEGVEVQSLGKLEEYRIMGRRYDSFINTGQTLQKPYKNLVQLRFYEKFLQPAKENKPGEGARDRRETLKMFLRNVQLWIY